jgi:hypothetical protein
VWTGLIWLRIGTCGVVLGKLQWTNGFHKVRGIFYLAEPKTSPRRTLLLIVSWPVTW